MSRLSSFLFSAFLLTPLLGQAADSDLQGYLARTDIPPDAPFVRAAEKFVERGKASGWWKELSAVYFFCAPTRDGALANVKSADFPLSAVGELTFTPYAGVAGDGKTGYLDTNTKVDGFPGFHLDSHSLFVFCQTDNPTVASELGASGDGSNVGLRVRNAVHASLWSANRVQIPYVVESGLGLTGFVRTGSDGGFRVKNSTVGDFAQKAVKFPSSSVRFFRQGLSVSLSTNQLAFGFIGSGKITREQATDLYAACTEMLESFGTLARAEETLSAKAPHAFARNAIDKVQPKGLEVFRLAPLPENDGIDFTESYPFGPLNNALIRPWGLAAKSADTQVGRWELIWSDRALGPSEGVHTSWAKKGNDTMGRVKTASGQECRTEFNSYEKAIGSTLVKTAYSAGLKFRKDPSHPEGKGWGDIAEEWGYDVSIWQKHWEKDQNDPIFSQDLPVDTGAIVHRAFCVKPENLPGFFSHDAVDGNFKTSRDRVILGQGRLADLPRAKGFVIDHEHADDRAPDLQVKFITEMAKIARSKNYKMGATGHAASGGSGKHGGWTAENANQLLHLFDWYTIVASSATPPEGQYKYLEKQYEFFKGPEGKLPVPAEKLCVQIQIGAAGQEVSVEDARIVRQFMLDKGIMRCLPANVYAQPGGDLQRAPNQVIATLLGLPLETASVQ